MTPEAIEAKIDSLRKAHTEAFKAKDWQKADRLRYKLLALWHRWDNAMADMAEADGITLAQAKLKRLHGTPEAFEAAIWTACGEISVDEARAAIEKYKREWKIAGTITY